MIIFTNAPADYDYSYMEDTGRRVHIQGMGGLPYRELIVHDEYRFANFQVPRYNSGLYIVLPADLVAFYLEQ